MVDREQAEHVESEIARRMADSPWTLLGVAAAVGYVAGGGLFSPMTRFLTRAALGALLVPGVRERIRGAAEEARSTFEGAAEGAGWQAERSPSPEQDF